MSAAATPLVSVCLITYNHEPYIAQAIDSVLAQRTRFPVEILIGEDESSDATRRIVLEYRDRYPQRIAVLLGERARVISVDGRATGRRNLVDTLSRARGKYIALLEGDDYWTDELKLQKQADFLETHPDYALCGHLVQTIEAEGRPAAEQFFSSAYGRERFEGCDAINGTPMHPSSWMFRSFPLSADRAYPALLKAPAGDDMLALMLLLRGKAYRLPQYCSAYRLHPGGTWSTLAKPRQGLVVLQFRCLAFPLVPWRCRPRLLLELAVGTIVLFRGVLAEALRRRSVAPLAEFLRRSAGQSVVSRPVLLLLYALAASLSPAYVLYKVVRALLGR
jgi:glycosyltransferase involved in cell wall biosynthesis